MRFRPTFVLRRAIDAARDALTRLDPAQVPAQLTPIVRGMTPSVEELALKALIEHEWLRDKAAAAWPEAGEALSGGPDEASALFLLRPPGWEGVLLRIGWEVGRQSGAAELDRVRRQVDDLKGDRDEAKRKARESTAEVARLAQVVKAATRATAEPVRSERKAASRAAEELQQIREAMTRDAATWARREGELRAEIERLQEAARKARQERADAVTRLEDHRGGPAWAGSGLELARLLDQIATGATRVLPDEEAEAVVEVLRLPPGVRPDSAEALDVVLTHPGPVHLVVDGYNAALAIGAGDPAEVRDRLDAVLTRLRLLARPPRAVTVIYDSREAGSSQRRPAGVEVVFAPPGVSADDEVVRMSAVPGAVVVSNDREVRERSAARGALALWSDALVAWTRRR